MPRRRVARSSTDERQSLTKRIAEIGDTLDEIRNVLNHSFTRPAPVAKRGSAAPRRRLAARSTRRAAPRGRPGAGLLSILRVLNQHASLRQLDISRHSGVTLHTVSNTLTGLKKRKWATNTPEGWSLTTAGKAELQRREKLVAAG